MYSDCKKFRTRLMNSLIGTVAMAAALYAVPINQASAGVAYTDPTGGWRYEYDGTFNGGTVAGYPAGYGDGNQHGALDGTWEHDQADKWDGSGIGDTQNPGSQTSQKSPGGVSALTEGTTTFIRMQDAGNPEAPQWGLYSGNESAHQQQSPVVFRHLVSNDGPLSSELIMD